MNLGLAFYHALGTLISIKMVPLFFLYSKTTGKYAAHLEERFGNVDWVAEKLGGKDASFWLHAASLGEVRVAASILAALKDILPGCSFIVSVYTEHGRRLVEEIFGNDIPVFYAPVDLWWAVGRSLERIRPKTMVFLETELWPAWLSACRRGGIRTVIANGRISPRSVDKYRMIRPLLREILSGVEVFSMIGDKDAERISLLGAPKERIRINGNAKYDLLLKNADPTLEAEVKGIIDPSQKGQIIVAGSTRAGEEELLLDALQRVRVLFKETVMVLAPRHITRTQEVARLVVKAGMGFHLWSDLVSGRERRVQPVVLIDTFGDLFKIYSSASIAFCGGSLVPLGGQNPLEPAAWGKPVFHGPSMEDFEDAKGLLAREGGSVEIDPSSLAEKLISFLNRPHELAMMGDRARKALAFHRGAAERHAQAIAGIMKPCEA
jgi:3-deoxy-D-manno-octulosonic-acid transferase